MGEQLPNINYDGVPLHKIHTWLQLGDGGKSMEQAQQAITEIAEMLRTSQERIMRVMRELGAEWEGDAGDRAGDSTARMVAWQAEADPILAANAQAVDELLGSWLETRSSLPSPAEAELTDREHTLAAAIPGLGPIVSKQLAEERLAKVTREAQDGMHRWHQQATAAVASVAPLPEVPAPVIQIHDPAAGRPITVDDSGHTDRAGVDPSVPVTPLPPGTPPGAPATPAPTPPAIPVNPPGSPGSPGGQPPALPINPPPPGGHHPGPGPGTPARPGVPAVVPPGPAGQGSGRGAQAGGAAPGRPGQPSRGPTSGTPNSPGAGGRPAATAPGAGTGGRGGIMQPAVGAGAGAKRDEDTEHKNKYADPDDDPFTDGIPKVAPPVIGAPDDRDR